MRPLVLVAALALLAAPAARAAPPEGFRASKPLGARVAKIAGKPTAVYCAASARAWRDFAGANGGHAAADGITFVSERTVSLPARVCQPLERWLRGRKVTVRVLGAGLHTLTHEAMHARGIRNEMRAECRALRLLPHVARRHFGVSRAATLRGIMGEARRRTYCT